MLSIWGATGGAKPTLSLQFAGATSLDSGITFSRGTQATMYGSSGLLQYAPNNLLQYSQAFDNAAWAKTNSFVQTNLLTYSQDFTNAAWTKTNNISVTAAASTAPDGTLTATQVTPNTTNATHSAAQTVSTSGTATVSVYVKPAGYNYFGFSGSGTNYVWFDIANGVVTSTLGTAWTAATITSVGNGWYRCTATTSAVMTRYDWYVSSVIQTDGNSIVSAAGNGTFGIYIWGAQLVQGSVPGDYRATTSAALPVLYSDPFGGTTAEKLVESSTGTAQQHIALQSATMPADTVGTVSIYLKAGERTQARLINYDGTSNFYGIVVDLTNGTFIATNTSGTYSASAYSISNAGNGWYRVSVTASLASTTRQFYVNTCVSATSSYAGDGTSGIYIWGAQLAQGSIAQTYNATTSAAYYGPRFDYDPFGYAQQNLLTYSQDFTNAAWVKSLGGSQTGSAIAPDGTATAFFWQENTASSQRDMYQAFSATAGVTYTASCYAKSGGGTKRYLNVYPQTAGTAWAIFDLDLGTVPATGGAQYVSSSITSAGNGWYRCSVTVTANTTAALNANYYIGDSSSTPAPTYTGNGTSALYIWGAQLNTGTSALPYAATTSAPYTLCTPKGLLIEEARTNLLTYSEQFDNAAWVKGDVTVTANAAVSPDGTTNADSVIEAATTAIHRINQSATISLSTAAAISFYVQAIGSRRLYINAVVAANVGALFDLTGSGTVVDLAGVAANKAASISQIGNGWYRCTVIGTGTGVANNIYAQINRSTSVTAADDTYLGDGTSGIRVYGAQMEAGSFATSYIPTVASTVTRSADVASMTGTNFSSWYNATQGTLVANWANLNTAQSTVAQISDGTANNRMLIQGNNGSGTMRNLVFVAGVAQVTTLDFSIAAGTHKDALAYSAGSYGASRDGAVTLTNSYASVPSGMNTLGIGYDGAAYANGWLASISYYNTRLPNSTLQALTA